MIVQLLNFPINVLLILWPKPNYSQCLSSIYQVDDFADAQSLLSMTMTSMRLAGLDPAISDAFQKSPGYLDMAQVVLRASTCKLFSTITSPLSSTRSGSASVFGSASQHKLQEPLNVPVLTLANANYSITRTYPSLLIVPTVSGHSLLLNVYNAEMI